MINYIKDAVSAVSGIKTFLFNTDYRNNFDLQNVEFPCCVLTPIMRTNYDLNNIIRESAELQLSVVDLAPYDYTGDDLYAINKRCSDLALQVIANLQVKSKLDKELTFEFILPSGDELISGVMCNLQCTMRQGSCIGAPSYVEIVVQPIKRESITSNGKYIITPSSGFNAMKEVEVDVDVPSAKIEPTKQVTFNDNVVATITPSEGYDALASVDVVIDVQPNLQDKQLTITENGTQTIVADEGYDGLNSVEVVSDIDTLQGLDFSSIYDQEQAEELNQYYKNGIAYAEEIKRNWDENRTSLYSLFKGNENLIYFPIVPMNNVLTMNSAFCQCVNLKKIIVNAPNCYNAASMCLKSGIEDVDITVKNGCDFSTFAYFGDIKKLKINLIKKNNSDKLKISFNCIVYGSGRLTGEDFIINNNSEDVLVTDLYYAFRECFNLRTINIVMDLSELGTTNNPNQSTTTAFNNCQELQYLRIKNWKKYNLQFQQSTKLSSESIHYLIQNAVNVVDGATARTLTLHATAKTNWQNSEYYEQDLAVLEQKGITIA